MKNQKKVEENLISMIAKIGEKITLGRMKTINNDNTKNYFYLHSIIKDNLSKLAVIISLIIGILRCFPNSFKFS